MATVYEQDKWELGELRRMHFGSDEVPYDIFPTDERKTTPVPAHRVAALRAHLTVQFAAMVTEEPAPPPREAIDSELTDLPLGSICAKCRGFCCRVGDTHAYLDADTLARAVRVTGSADHLVERYLNFVPKRTQTYSCIFHGVAGCALPRELRSDTCNDFLCPALTKLAKTWQAEPEKPYIAAFRQSGGGFEVYAVENLVPRRLAVSASDPDEPG